jgi:hypothetical protein
MSAEDPIDAQATALPAGFKRPEVASLLSLLITGSGQIYNGEATGAAVGATVGGVAGAGAALTAVAVSGPVAGLGAAGITSGLAAVGSMMGGGMATGLIITAAAPIVGALAIGYGGYRLAKWYKASKSVYPAGAGS